MAKERMEFKLDVLDGATLGVESHASDDMDADGDPIETKISLFVDSRDNTFSHCTMTKSQFAKLLFVGRSLLEATG